MQKSQSLKYTTLTQTVTMHIHVAVAVAWLHMVFKWLHMVTHGYTWLHNTHGNTSLQIVTSTRGHAALTFLSPSLPPGVCLSFRITLDVIKLHWSHQVQSWLAKGGAGRTAEVNGYGSVEGFWGGVGGGGGAG